MALPGFNAEHSLSRSNGYYGTNGFNDTGLNDVVPQLQAGLGLSTCSRVCSCCRRTKNRFCCSHCRWCSGPIGSTGVTLY
jgi:hypothetical protein